MSFFGFDTTLPRDRNGQSSQGYLGGNDATRSSAAAGGMDDQALDEKIRGLTAGAQEDVEIYEWGGEGYDGLGDMLEEEGDDFNADTFGGDVGSIGKDFDFGRGSATAPATSAPKSKPMDSMFASNFDDFWALPSLSQQRQQQQQQQQPSQPIQPEQPVGRPGKTMEEIEAELRAAHLSHAPAEPEQQQQSQPPPPARRGLTMEEIEAEMRKNQGQQPAPPTSMPPGPVPVPMFGSAQPLPPFPGMPASVAAMMQGGPLPGPPPTEAFGADFPPLGSSGPRAPPVTLPSSQTAAGPEASGPGARGPPGGPALPPAAAAMHQAHASLQAQQAEHFGRMQAMLRALPDSVQQGITALPPQMHFDILQGVCAEFPVLLQTPSTDEDRRVIKMAEDAALGRLRMIEGFEQRKRVRDAKIAAMSRNNNVMTVSDKEFITRIQISQILPADPYADDFYAHIYFALRGRAGPNPGLMGQAPQPQQPPRGPKKGNMQRMNAQQKAMLRMQQQVARLVADRNQRIEKAAQGTANPNLEGSLGKVGMNLAGNPKQALQISKAKDDMPKTDAQSAADVVRRALEGASLEGNSASGQANQGGRRPPLTRHEALRILEKLYDVLLSLEQLRRGTGEDADAQAEQDALKATLWKELRVLEPLEISDPHPFVSLLNTIKGKRLLPRALRHLTNEQTLTALTMIVASFDSLDVVRQAGVLDDVSALVSNAPLSEQKRDVEAQTDAFANLIVPAMLGLMSTSPFKIVIGMLALFVERNNVVDVVRSRAGIAFLTSILSRAEALRQETSDGNAPESAAAGGKDGGDDATVNAPPTAEEKAQWSNIFQLLFERLVTGSGGLSNLFPSTRAKQHLPFGVSYYMLQGGQGSSGALLQSSLDELDEPVWNLYAALAVSSSMEQQSILVQELREKILENVLEARSKQNSQEGARKLRLVNIFLNALNLDASQITV
ncbi:unnamed protein product [Parajaminaea phylloscopi]